MGKNSFFEEGTFLLFLAFLSAFGPLVTDMYLPALPQLQGFFSTNESMAQLSLSTSMLGLAVGQIFIGPLSDKYGRKPLLILSILTFIVATATCIYSLNIEIFVLLRFVQGVGGSGCIVLSRSVATDFYSGEKFVKMMAIIGVANSITPTAASVVGGMMTESFGWRGIFWVLVLIGVLLFVGSCMMRETLKSKNHSNYGANHGTIRIFSSFQSMFHNSKFMYVWMHYGFCGGVFFSYISSSTFIIQQHYGFSALMFSLIFGLNALMIGVGSVLSMKLKSPINSSYCASFVLVISSVAECLVMWADGAFWLYEIFAVVLLLSAGICFTSSSVVMLQEECDNAGAASALIGTITLVIGGLISPLLGLGIMTHTTGFALVICALISLFFSFKSKAAAYKAVLGKK